MQLDAPVESAPCRFRPCVLNEAGVRVRPDSRCIESLYHAQQQFRLAAANVQHASLRRQIEEFDQLIELRGAQRAAERKIAMGDGGEAQAVHVPTG